MRQLQALPAVSKLVAMITDVQTGLSLLQLPDWQALEATFTYSATPALQQGSKQKLKTSSSMCREKSKQPTSLHPLSVL